jgi:hypothetical protein
VKTFTHGSVIVSFGSRMLEVVNVATVKYADTITSGFEFAAPGPS